MKETFRSVSQDGQNRTKSSFMVCIDATNDLIYVTISHC